MLQRLSVWRRVAAARHECSRQARAHFFALGALCALKAWRRESRWCKLLLVGAYVGVHYLLRCALRTWRHDHVLERPVDTQWGMVHGTGTARREAARTWATWRRAATVWRVRYQRLGLAYSHWQLRQLASALLHWHHVAQLSLDIDLARLLGAQAVGHFDIRLLPGFVQPSLQPVQSAEVSFKL